METFQNREVVFKGTKNIDLKQSTKKSRVISSQRTNKNTFERAYIRIIEIRLIRAKF